MSNEFLNSLLKEYEYKKLKAELDLEKRKKELYHKVPELQQIEDELNHFAILTAKNILLHNNSSLKELNRKTEILKQKKSSILKDANLPHDFLTPNYECLICQDTGYISSINGKTQMCNCLKQKLLDVSFHKSNIANLSQENFSTFNETLFSDEIDLSKYRFNISPRQNIQNIKQKCLDFIQSFNDLNTKNLLFVGNTGLRKNFYVKLYCSRIIKKGQDGSLSDSSCIT